MRYWIWPSLKSPAHNKGERGKIKRGWIFSVYSISHIEFKFYPTQYNNYNVIHSLNKTYQRFLFNLILIQLNKPINTNVIFSQILILNKILSWKDEKLITVPCEKNQTIKLNRPNNIRLELLLINMTQSKIENSRFVQTKLNWMNSVLPRADFTIMYGSVVSFFL